MWALWAIAVVAWSLVPYKAWSRDLFGSEGFNIGDVVLLAVLLPSAAYVWKNFKQDKLWLSIILLWGATAFSLCKGIVLGEDLREMLRVGRAVTIWAVIPFMILKIREADILRRWVIGMTVLLALASVSIVIFSYYPTLIPTNDEVASIRGESYEGVERVFTSGMWGVFTGVIFVISVLVVSVRSKTGPLIVGVILVFGLLHTFVRTYVLLLVLALAMMLWSNWRVAVRTASLPVVLLALLMLVFGLPDSLKNLADATVFRISGLFQADFSQLDPSDLNAYGTLIWRLAEIDAAVRNLKGFFDIFLGVMGRPYSLDSSYSSTVPHISYFGIFYLNGVLGVVSYLASFSIISVRLWKNYRATVCSAFAWVTKGAFVAWVCLLLGSISAPLFQFAYGVSCFAFVVGLSEVAQRLSLSEKPYRDGPP